MGVHDEYEAEILAATIDLVSDDETELGAQLGQLELS